MIHNDIFPRFVAASPVCVLVPTRLENTLSPTTVDAVWERHAEWPSPQDLRFSDVVHRMSRVVGGIRPSIHSAFTTMAPVWGVTQKAVDDPIDRIETPTSAAWARHAGSARGAIRDELGGRHAPGREGDRITIREGSHWPGAARRIQPPRCTRAGALPGHSWVVLDPERMRVADVVPCVDGHAQERAMTAAILAMVPPGDWGITDRNWGTTAFRVGIARRGGSFVTRPQGSTLRGETVGEWVSQGRCETGAVFEPTVRPSHDDGEILFARRITVEWDQPTRDGDRTIPILTHWPETAADAVKVAARYRRRWTLETAFPEWEASLHGALPTRGDPTPRPRGSPSAWPWSRPTCRAP